MPRLVLSQHYRLDILPLWLVAIVQYVALIGFVLLLVWITSFFEPVSEGGYWDMFRSFTIPYIIGALAYYWQLHREIQKANQTLEKLKERRK